MSNPYRAPGAAVADQDRQYGSPVKAVIFGVLVDLGGTVLASIALVFAYGIVLGTQGASTEEIESSLSSMDPFSGIGIAASVLGFGCSFLGGYVCARVAGRLELKWAGVVAAISLVAGTLLGAQAYSLAVNLLLGVLGVGIVLLGGYAGARRNARG